VEKEGSSSSDVDAERSGVRCRVASPNWRAHEGEQEREMGGGVSSVPRAGRKMRERESGPRARQLAAQTIGSGWLQAAQSEATVRAHSGGGLANKGGWRGAGDAVRRD
jgi:hypothetical protein